MKTSFVVLAAVLFLVIATVFVAATKDEMTDAEWEAEMTNYSRDVDKFFQMAEEAGLNVTLKQGRHRRSVKHRRCGRLFLFQMQTICNHCVGPKPGRQLPERSVYDVCCKDGCTDSFIKDSACCE